MLRLNKTSTTLRMSHCFQTAAYPWGGDDSQGIGRITCLVHYGCQEDHSKDGKLHTGIGQGPIPSLVGDINRSHLWRRAKGFCLFEEGGHIFHEQRKMTEKPFHSD
jgi:hypothetical protein